MKKGCFGYIGSMKIKSGTASLALSAIAVLIYFTGLHFFPENKTAVGILTVVVCVPAAMAVVRFIMFMRFPAGSREVHDIIEGARGEVPVFYDSIITTPDKSYGVNAFISSDGSLLGYTEYAKVDTPKLEKHLRDIFSANKYTSLNIKVFTDKDKFLDRLKALAERQGSDTGHDEAILHLIGRISL
ncbi:MAG: hypothetical protein IJT24_03595 [Lachnospiraceae bacterium]|nr:hypothetical protein [Lachnospiraceae bacterium]